MSKKYLALFKSIGECAKENNLNIFLVGGCVRDFYLKRRTLDIDITVTGDAKPLIDFCVKNYGAKVEEFDAFGTARVLLDFGLKLDFVRARKEVYFAPAALPTVSPGTISEDLFRRDFTSNAWALSIRPERFFESFDPYGAQNAIDGKYIKVLHDNSFVDDPTRLYRAARFAGRFGWGIEQRTSELMRRAVEGGTPLLLSRERIRQELIKILEEPEAEAIFTILEDYKLLDFIYPGLKWSEALAKVKSVQERLGVMAMSLEGLGGDFISSLHLEREYARALVNAWEVYRTKLSPLKELSKIERSIIKSFAPGLPIAALKPCFLTGGELMALGFKGVQISRLQLILRQKQFSGEIKTKSGALKELNNIAAH